MIEGAVMWTSLETAELMALWRRTETQQMFRSSGRNLAIWERLAEELLERGFYRTAHQCRAKLHNMVCLYRKVERGELPRARCRHYDTLRGVLSAGSREELERFNAPWEERCRRERLLREQELSQLSKLPVGDRQSPGQIQLSPGQTQLSPGQTQLSPGQTQLSPGQTQLSPRQTQLSPGQTQLSPDHPQLSPATAGSRSASSPLGSASSTGRRPPPTLVPLGDQGKIQRRQLPELLPLSALSPDRAQVRPSLSPGYEQQQTVISPGSVLPRTVARKDSQTNESVSSQRTACSAENEVSSQQLDLPTDLSVRNVSRDATTGVKRKAEEDLSLAKRLPGSAFVRVIPEALLRAGLGNIDFERRDVYKMGQDAESVRRQRLASALAFMRETAASLNGLRVERCEKEVTPAPSHWERPTDLRLGPADLRKRDDTEQRTDRFQERDGRYGRDDSVPFRTVHSSAETEDMPLSLVTTRCSRSPPPPQSCRLIISSSRSRSPASPHRLIINDDSEVGSSSSPPPGVPAAHPAISVGHCHPVSVVRCGTPPPAHCQSVVGRLCRSRASSSPSPPRTIAPAPPHAEAPLGGLQHQRLMGLRGSPELLKPQKPTSGFTAWQTAEPSVVTWRRVHELLSDATGAQMAAYPFLGTPVALDMR
ncbi:Trihelix transcription factor GT-3a [Amphibalanus amphitrite]|uniref:Trihelix transcription factor GT-3a n=1 Tax=Amphibalanus amphitrite TaxID=1232801 RepID=A0A6A4WWZ1_AMPAM|nr:Trihelix transcription factor GT-3a [Amphibalanus amphitrite]